MTTNETQPEIALTIKMERENRTVNVMFDRTAVTCWSVPALHYHDSGNLYFTSLEAALAHVADYVSRTQF